MIIERHNGLKLFRPTGESQRPMNIHKVQLVNIPEQIEMNVRFSYPGDPNKVLTSPEEPVEFFTIEVNGIGFRFENLEIGNFYFDVFTNPKKFKEDENILDFVKKQNSSWLI